MIILMCNGFWFRLNFINLKVYILSHYFKIWNDMVTSPQLDLWNKNLNISTIDQIAFTIIFTNFRFYVTNFFYSFVVSPMVLRGMDYGSLMNMHVTWRASISIRFHAHSFHQWFLFIFCKSKNKIVVPNFNPLNYNHHHDKCIYILQVKMLNVLLIFAPF